MAEQEWQCTEDMGSRRGARSNFFLKFHQLVSFASQRQSYRGVYQKARMCGRSSEHRLMVVLRPLTNPSFSQSASDQIILTCSRGCAVLSSLLERKRFGAKKKGRGTLLDTATQEPWSVWLTWKNKSVYTEFVPTIRNFDFYLGRMLTCEHFKIATCCYFNYFSSGPLCPTLLRGG